MNGSGTEEAVDCHETALGCFSTLYGVTLVRGGGWLLLQVVISRCEELHKNDARKKDGHVSTLTEYLVDFLSEISSGHGQDKSNSSPTACRECSSSCCWLTQRDAVLWFGRNGEGGD
jgi:hypothetical protein